MHDLHSEASISIPNAESMVNITVAGRLIDFLLGMKQSSFAWNEYRRPVFQYPTSVIGVDGFIHKLVQKQSLSYCFRNIKPHSLQLTLPPWLHFPDDTF